MGLFFRVFDASLFLVVLIKLSNVILSIRFTPKFASNNPEFINKNIVLGKRTKGVGDRK